MNGNVNQIKYAGFWLRAGAGLIDIVLIAIPIHCISVITIYLISGETFNPEMFPLLGGGENPFTYIINLILPLCLLFMFLFTLCYSFFLTRKWQATLGKRIMKIYVVDCTGSKLSFVHAAFRTSMPLLLVFIFFFTHLFLLKDMYYKSYNDEEVEKRIFQASLPKTYESFKDSEAVLADVTVILLSLHSFYYEGKVENYDYEIANKTFESEDVNIDEVVNHITNSIEPLYKDADLVRATLQEFLSFNPNKQIYIKKQIFDGFAAEYLKDSTNRFFYVGAFFLVLLFVWYALMIFTKEKTALHDIIAKTRVIKGRP